MLGEARETIARYALEAVTLEQSPVWRCCLSFNGMIGELRDADARRKRRVDKVRGRLWCRNIQAVAQKDRKNLWKGSSGKQQHGEPHLYEQSQLRGFADGIHQTSLHILGPPQGCRPQANRSHCWRASLEATFQEKHWIWSQWLGCCVSERLCSRRSRTVTGCETSVRYAHAHHGGICLEAMHESTGTTGRGAPRHRFRFVRCEERGNSRISGNGPPRFGSLMH